MVHARIMNVAKESRLFSSVPVTGFVSHPPRRFTRVAANFSRDREAAPATDGPAPFSFGGNFSRDVVVGEPRLMEMAELVGAWD